VAHRLLITPQTWNTGITDTGATAITIDRGLPSEQTFALKPEYADGLGMSRVLMDQLGERS
jgi:hypothetical protein